MSEDRALAIDYADHEAVVELIDVVTDCAESISCGFEDWSDERVRGPGLYVVVVAGTSVAAYADPMGENRWPTDDCRVVDANDDAFFETARSVAFECDGAVIVSVDGVIHEQMVRLKDVAADEVAADPDAVDYADWMGARHMSALDTSLREPVVAAITLSEENGRVTVFQDGEYDATERPALGGEWRVEE